MIPSAKSSPPGTAYPPLLFPQCPLQDDPHAEGRQTQSKTSPKQVLFVCIVFLVYRKGILGSSCSPAVLHSTVSLCVWGLTHQPWYQVTGTWMLLMHSFYSSLKSEESKNWNNTARLWRKDGSYWFCTPLPNATRTIDNKNRNIMCLDQENLCYNWGKKTVYKFFTPVN